MICPPRSAPRASLALAKGWALACAVASALGCATAPGGPLTAAPAATSGRVSLPELEVDHLEERALLLLIADRRTWEPVAVQAALEAGPEVRRLAALTLGRLGDRRGADRLTGLLGDADVAVRRAAAFALGELGERGHGEVARPLLRGVDDPDREVGVRAVEALAKSGLTLEAVVERLIDGPADEFLPRLLPSLFRFQSRAAPSEAVARWAAEGLGESDPELRAMAAYALARVPVPASRPRLRQLLLDGDPWIRAWGARALGEVGERSDFDRLRPLLDDPDPGPIVHALRAARRLLGAGKAAPAASWRPRLLELLDDPRAGVRVTAIEAAADWLLDEAISARLVAFTEGGHRRERQLALLALAEGEDPAAGAVLGRATGDADPAIRRAAAQAAGLLGAAATLERLADDADPTVRAAALETWLAGEPTDVAERARRALDDPDAGVRAVAFEWLELHPVLELEALHTGLAAAGRDRLLDARLAAVRALRARAEAVRLERGALIAGLEELAADPSWLVRREAAAALESLGREAPELGALRLEKTVATYREIVQRTRRPRRVALTTERGELVVELACPEAPLTCLNFLQLAHQGFYDGLPFHRVVPDFVVQAGDPRGDGRGGPGYAIRDETNLRRVHRGALAMARAGPDTGGSQFFVALTRQPHLDGGYTVFGQVVAGWQVLDQILQGDRILGVEETAR